MNNHYFLAFITASDILVRHRLKIQVITIFHLSFPMYFKGIESGKKYIFLVS